MLGEWSDYQIVLIGRNDYDDESKSNVCCSTKICMFIWILDSALPISTHKLQPPFHNFIVHGDLLLMKLGDDSVPLNYTKAEYEEFQKLQIEEWELDDEEDDDEEGEEGDDQDGMCMNFLCTTWNVM